MAFCSIALKMRRESERPHRRLRTRGTLNSLSFLQRLKRVGSADKSHWLTSVGSGAYDSPVSVVRTTRLAILARSGYNLQSLSFRPLKCVAFVTSEGI